MSELPPGWATATISDLCGKPQYGWTTKAAKTGVLQLLRTTDITRGPIDWNSVPWSAKEPPNRQQFLLRSGDIVVSRAGSVGVSAMVHDPRPAVFASYLMRLRPAEEVSGRFIAWFLQAPNFWRQVERASAGIALQNINATKLAAFQMPLPPLAEQRRIVAAIEEQFSRLENGTRTLVLARRRLEGLARQIIRDAFSEDWPQHELVHITNPTRPICYGILKPRTVGELVIPYIEVRSIKAGRIDLESLHRTTQELHDQFRRSALSPGDVVLAIRGSFDRAAVVPAELVGANVSRDVARIAPLQDLDPAYLAHYLAGPDAFRYFAAAARGVGVRGVNIGDLRRMPIPLPPLADQRRIVAELEQQLSLIDALRAAVESAQKRSAALRRAILERALRGELVPQDPADEPASVLLERIRADRAAAPARPSRRRATMETS